MPVMFSVAVRSAPVRSVVSACAMVTVRVPPRPLPAATPAVSDRVRVDSSMVSVAVVKVTLGAPLGSWNGIFGAPASTVSTEPFSVPVTGPEPAFSCRVDRNARAAEDKEKLGDGSVVPVSGFGSSGADATLVAGAAVSGACAAAVGGTASTVGAGVGAAVDGADAGGGAGAGAGGGVTTGSADVGAAGF